MKGVRQYFKISYSKHHIVFQSWAGQAGERGNYITETASAGGSNQPPAI